MSEEFNIGTVSEQIKSMGLTDLVNLVDCSRSLSNIVAGLMSQPRFSGSKGLTPAGELLDDMCSLMNRIISTASEAVHEYAPRNQDEVETRAWCLISDHAYGEYNLSDLLSILAETQNNLDKMARDEAMQARKAA